METNEKKMSPYSKRWLPNKFSKLKSSSLSEPNEKQYSKTLVYIQSIGLKKTSW